MVDSQNDESTETVSDVEQKIIDVIKTCYDPEIPVNIYDLGLIYSIDVGPTNDVQVAMTLTSPACPVAETLPPDVESKIKELDEVNECKVEVVWEPPWDQDKMTEAARLQLGLD